MLVEFSVENFRSIRSEQLFSLKVEDKSTAHMENMVEQPDGLKILKTAAIYGANASGKTNLLKALQTLISLITNSASLKDGDPIPQYEPYLLGVNSEENPTSFSIELYIGAIRYTYNIKYNSTSILYERLDYYPSTRSANLFTRKSPTDWKSIKFGDHYKGGRKQFAFFANNAYLSKAGGSPDAPKIVRDFFNFINRHFVIIPINFLNNFDSWLDNLRNYSTLNNIIKNIDIGISGITIQVLTNNADNNESFIQKLLFHHKTEDGKTIKFPEDKESNGTIQLYKALPLLAFSLQQGNILLIDELENHLHPHICELVIKLFNDPLVNTKNAQLIFTTHDLSLMSPHLLRKDQIYLVEKSPEKGSEFYSLDSFDSNLKDSSPFAKWYNEGRLGGIPQIDYRAVSEAIRSVVENG